MGRSIKMDYLSEIVLENVKYTGLAHDRKQ
jgi:hypothetical protein